MMVTAHVLIVIYAGVYGRPVIATQEFNSIQACEAALIKVSETFGAERARDIYYLSCIKK